MSIVVVLVFFDVLQNCNLVASSSLSIDNGLMEGDVVFVTTYLPLFLQVEAQYFEKNNVEPRIKCTQCTTRQLSMTEFGKALIGMLLKDVMDGKNDSGQMQLFFKLFIKVVSEGSHANIINHMLYVYNEIYRVCPFCGFDGKGDTWQAVT